MSKSGNGLKAFVLAIALSCLASCVPSFHGLYDEKTLTFSKELLGSWKASDGSDPITFVADQEKPFYELVNANKKQHPEKMRVALVKLGGKFYFDTIPLVPTTGFGDQITLWHNFLKVEINAKELRVYMADQEWLDRYLQKHPTALAHFEDNGHSYLTASTGELQAFVASHDEFFEHESSIFRRE